MLVIERAYVDMLGANPNLHKYDNLIQKAWSFPAKKCVPI
mgnify:CR=1 FL=1